MSRNPATTAALVIGCGFLGLALSRQLQAAGAVVEVTTRSSIRAAQLVRHGLQARLLDLATPATWTASRELIAAAAVDVFVLIPPSGITVVDGRPVSFAAFVHWLHGLPLRRAVLASSTGIYGDHGGATVTAETPVEPHTDREHKLNALERCWLDASDLTRVVRLAGLYGPGRVIGKRSLLAGEAIGGSPQHCLNLIEAGDAAALLRVCATNDGCNRIELGTDGQPVSRLEYYSHLAALLKAPPPVFGGAPARGEGSRRCDGASTIARTGWRPRYPDFRAGVAAALAAEAATAE